VAVTVDLSAASGPKGVTAADLATPEALFGASQGLAALREVLRRHAIRATFAVPAVIAHIHPDLVRALAAEGHEIAAHGFRHEDVSELEPDEERRRIARTTEILAEIVGREPAGWFSLPRQGDRYAVGAVSPTRSISCARPATSTLATDWPTTSRIIRSATSQAAARC
jgi:peptidoglycan/xylan/chitin deacetylase (PgdA/CDA1 family)